MNRCDRNCKKMVLFQVEPDDIVTEFDTDNHLPSGFADRVSTPDDEQADEKPAGAALVTAENGAESAVEFLTNTLSSLSDSQKSVLNSQAANRELLGVLLQDNFNLKEENNRLRERILQVEKEVAQTRQEDEWRREALRKELDAKIFSVNQIATEAVKAANSVEVPEIKTIETKAGCLGSLLGLKNQQIITVPRRRKNEGGVKPSQPLPANHPKPLFPPE